MTVKTLAPTYAALMYAVADPTVRVDATVERGSRWDQPDVWQYRPGDMALKVTGRFNRLRAAGLVTLGPLGVSYHRPRKVELTKAGQEWITNNPKG